MGLASRLNHLPHPSSLVQPAQGQEQQRTRTCPLARPRYLVCCDTASEIAWGSVRPRRAHINCPSAGNVWLTLSRPFQHRRASKQHRSTDMQLLLALGSALLTPMLAAALPAPAPQPSPPGIPSESTARSELSALTVAARGSSSGYSRDVRPTQIQTGK